TASSRPCRAQRRSVDAFESFPEQQEAKRLLRAALAEGPAHAYLFHGPAGVGKRTAALAFAAELIDPSSRAKPASSPGGAAESAPSDHRRVTSGVHPDLYLVEPVGDQIRIDDVRARRRDLHMRPFEADRRVYVVYSAETMNEDAADALLKDLEEPPPYVVIVLVADDLGPLPETIRSRCQLIPFRRLSETAVRAAVRARAPELDDDEVTTVARVAGGRLDRAERLLDPAAPGRRAQLPGVARAVHVDRLEELRQDASRDRLPAAEEACEVVRHTWREAEELQLSVPLAVEALLLRLRRVLA